MQMETISIENTKKYLKEAKVSYETINKNGSILTITGTASDCLSREELKQDFSSLNLTQYKNCTLKFSHFVFSKKTNITLDISSNIVFENCHCIDSIHIVSNSVDFGNSEFHIKDNEQFSLSTISKDTIFNDIVFSKIDSNVNFQCLGKQITLHNSVIDIKTLDMTKYKDFSFKFIDCTFPFGINMIFDLSNNCDFENCHFVNELKITNGNITLIDNKFILNHSEFFELYIDSEENNISLKNTKLIDNSIAKMYAKKISCVRSHFVCSKMELDAIKLCLKNSFFEVNNFVCSIVDWKEAESKIIASKFVLYNNKYFQGSDYIISNELIYNQEEHEVNKEKRCYMLVNLNKSSKFDD